MGRSGRSLLSGVLPIQFFDESDHLSRGGSASGARLAHQDGGVVLTGAHKRTIALAKESIKAFRGEGSGNFGWIRLVGHTQRVAPPTVERPTPREGIPAGCQAEDTFVSEEQDPNLIILAVRYLHGLHASHRRRDDTLWFFTMLNVLVELMLGTTPPGEDMDPLYRAIDTSVTRFRVEWAAWRAEQARRARYENGEDA